MSIRATTFVASLQPASSHALHQRHACCQQKRQQQQVRQIRKPVCCRGSHVGLQNQKDEGQVCVVIDFPSSRRKPMGRGEEIPN